MAVGESHGHDGDIDGALEARLEAVDSGGCWLEEKKVRFASELHDFGRMDASIRLHGTTVGWCLSKENGMIRSSWRG
jgi:hypothetical protein